jgi:hypothetical protein
MVVGTKEPTTFRPAYCVKHTYGGVLLLSKFLIFMLNTKNENGLNGNSSRQTTPVDALFGNPKATEAINLFPDINVKLAMTFSRVGEESPLYHFMGLYEVAKSYINCNRGIDEHVRENFDTLVRSMDFYLNLVNAAHADDE